MSKLSVKRIFLLFAVSIAAFLLFITRNSEAVSPIVKSEAPPESIVSVHGIDVDQGASTLIKAEDCTVLIDTGEEAYSGKLLNYLKGEDVSSIDMLFITHPHRDHYGAAIKLIEEVEVKEAFIPHIPDNMEADDILWDDMLSTLSKNNVDIFTLSEKESFPLGKGAELELLGPFLEDAKNLNDLSLSFKLICGENSLLITGDCEKAAEKALLSEDIDADILFSGHHGSKTSANDFFVEKVSPEASFISVGFGNSHGLPDRKHIENLLKYGDVYRSDLDGSVVFYMGRGGITAFKEKGMKL